MFVLAVLLAALPALPASTTSTTAPVAPAFQGDRIFPEVVQYDLTLIVDTESREIVGHATVEIRAAKEPLEEVRFSLNNLLKIDEVRDGKRKLNPLAGDRIAEGKAWTVKLQPTLKAGESREIHFDYHGEGSNPGSGDSDWMGIMLVREDEVRMSHQSQWYPIVPLDDRARAKISAPTRLKLVLPRGMESLGPGQRGLIEKQKKQEIHHWESQGAVRASILAGAYEEQIVKSGKQQVRVLSFKEHKRGAKLWGQEAANALKTFSKLFGDLGKRSYGIAEMHVTNRKKSYNYEADGFSVYDSVLFDGRAPDTRKIAHEVAHLYFGGAVDAYGNAERFLTESMAEAAAFVYLEESEGQEAAQEAAKRAGERYFRSSGKEDALFDADFNSPRYYQVVYGKGALALRTLRHWVGPEDFDKLVKGFVADCLASQAHPTIGSFLQALRKEFGETIDHWEDDWLRRTGSPKYSLEFELEPQGGRKTRIHGFAIQEGKIYRNPLELGLVSKSGKRSVIEIRPQDSRMRFEAVVPHDIEEVVIDPRFLMLTKRD